MAWVEDLAFLAVPPCTLGTDLFISRQATIPKGDGPYTSLIEVIGMMPERTHNSVVIPAYQHPAAQVLTRALSYPVARARAWALYQIYSGQRNVTINGTWYREINVNQEPFDLGHDDTGRVRVAFNVSGVKRPS